MYLVFVGIIPHCFKVNYEKKKDNDGFFKGMIIMSREYAYMRVLVFI